ncbi:MULTISPECIES: outer membrane protein assembly factor BamE [unclassified Methylophaga]|jgi:outer membrane protein assembly factor BamE|uniref:outer membrane protein assembly factor BamE n=1 Tax=unclassified Methylophaga TaxID=2629249 RepID=UPI0025F1642C|nr:MULTISPECIES: outer membrane protein assembly factor BamE [unclassified Methylophaga]|tara:strand:- start:126 stop:704 length:579 start_codon:yes stop_codon:yes gene_type:complete
MKSLLIYSLSLVILTLSACSKDKIPGVYRIDIQQGNQVTQEMLSKLEPGMTKSQVSFVMGTPMLIDVFHPNRWDYIYSFHPGNGSREQRRITLYFDEAETLDYIDGNTQIVENIQLTEEQRTDTNVVVPLNEKETGFFNSIFNVFGLGEDEVEIIEDDNETDAAKKKQKEALPENSDDSMGTQPAGQLPDIQ